MTGMTNHNKAAVQGRSVSQSWHHTMSVGHVIVSWELSVATASFSAASANPVVTVTLSVKVK